MKKIMFLLAVCTFFVTAKTNAQEDANRECQIKYNLFKGDYKSKKYDDAFTNWTLVQGEAHKHGVADADGDTAPAGRAWCGRAAWMMISH